MSTELIIGLSVGGGLLLFFVGVFLGCLMMFSQLTQPRALAYEVIPVSPGEMEDAFCRLNPLVPKFADFADGVLNNPAYGAWYETVRADLRRYGALWAGKALYVRVKSMP